MRKSVWLRRGLLPLLAVLLPLMAQAQVQKLDRVVAVVDDDVVMATELEQRMRTVTNQIRSQNVQAPPLPVLRRQVLEQLIVERLQLQIAARAGVTISEAELDQAIERFRQGSNVTPEQFAAKLAEDGISMASFREQIRQELLINRVERGSVNRRIQITDQEIDNFLRSKEGEFWKSPTLELGHILISVSSSAPAEEASEAEAKAQKIYDDVVGGADFRRQAIANSSGQNALQGGDLGWRKTAELPTLFADALEGLKVGEVTKPFRSDAGYHLLKVHDQRGATEQVVQQTKVRHILIKPSEVMSDDDAYNKLIEFREKLQKGEADFAELAREHSEDIGTMLQGGDLGWSTPGQFVPEFEQTMGQTPVGEIALPFRSQFGWHLLEVMDRRDQDMTEQYIRNQAANLLRSRRYEEEVQNWRREIRDEAYIDIKVPELRPDFEEKQEAAQDDATE